jgi:hypothetical protein
VGVERRQGIQQFLGAAAAGGAMYQKTYVNGAWSGWKNLGGVFQGTPAVTYHDGRLDMFAIEPGTHAIYQRTYSGGAWDTWHSIGGGDFDGYAQSPINHAISGSAWGAWHSLGGDFS